MDQSKASTNQVFDGHTCFACGRRNEKVRVNPSSFPYQCSAIHRVSRSIRYRVTHLSDLNWDDDWENLYRCLVLQMSLLLQGHCQLVSIEWWESFSSLFHWIISVRESFQTFPGLLSSLVAMMRFLCSFVLHHSSLRNLLVARKYSEKRCEGDENFTLLMRIVLCSTAFCSGVHLIMKGTSLITFQASAVYFLKVETSSIYSTISDLHISLS